MAKATKLLNLDEYDAYLVQFSGGKDSLAMVLDLLERGVDKSKIQLWHQRIDGSDEDGRLMDWTVTEAYCSAVAQALDIPIYFQWSDGGFEAEMNRSNSTRRGMYYQTTTGTTKYLRPSPPAKACSAKLDPYISDERCGHVFTGAVVWDETRRVYVSEECACPKCGKSRKGAATRGKFPQVAADLSIRWCSSYLKIDVAKRVINATFKGTKERKVKVLVLTGERREESANRAKYHECEEMSSTKTKIVHQWRSVIDWSEQQVWDIIKRFKINPHPCYHLGFGRCSCMTCIFGDKDQFATVLALDPERFERIAKYEEQFGCTIKRKQSVRELAADGAVFEQVASETDEVYRALHDVYPVEDVIVDDWKLPAGAGRAMVCGGPS